MRHLKHFIIFLSLITAYDQTVIIFFRAPYLEEVRYIHHNKRNDQMLNCIVCTSPDMAMVSVRIDSRVL